MHDAKQLQIRELWTSSQEIVDRMYLPGNNRDIENCLLYKKKKIRVPFAAV